MIRKKNVEKTTINGIDIIFIIKQLNVTQIVQSENWEERLDNLAQTYGINGKLPFVTNDLKEKLNSYSEIFG